MVPVRLKLGGLLVPQAEFAGNFVDQIPPGFCSLVKLKVRQSLLFGVADHFVLFRDRAKSL